jgi:hypothetical protein
MNNRKNFNHIPIKDVKEKTGKDENKKNNIPTFAKVTPEKKMRSPNI